MKFPFIITSILMLALCTDSFASKSDLFQVDQNKIKSEMADLCTLEEYVKQHPSMVLADLQNDRSRIGITEEMLGVISSLEPPLGIPSFLWGCVFWVPGVVATYILSEEDQEETKLAVYGCIVATLFGSAFSFLRVL